MKKTDLNEIVLQERFINTLEIERNTLGYTQQQMADLLNMSLSSYRRTINGEVGFKGLYTIAMLYYITGRFCFELVDVHDTLLDVVSKLRTLDADDLQLVSELIDRLKK